MRKGCRAHIRRKVVVRDDAVMASTHLGEVVHVSAVDVVQVNDVEIRGLARRRQRRPGTTQVLRQLAGDHAL